MTAPQQPDEWNLEIILEAVANYYAKQARAVGFDELTDTFFSIHQAEAIIQQHMREVERAAVIAELEDLKNLCMMDRTTVSGLNRVIGTHLARLQSPAKPEDVA